MHETHNVSANLFSQVFRFMFSECLTRSALNGMVSSLYSALVTKDRRASNFTDFRKFQCIFRILQCFRSFFSHFFCSFRQEQKATNRTTQTDSSSCTCFTIQTMYSGTVYVYVLQANLYSPNVSHR